MSYDPLTIFLAVLAGLVTLSMVSLAIVAVAVGRRLLLLISGAGQAVIRPKESHTPRVRPMEGVEEMVDRLVEEYRAVSGIKHDEAEVLADRLKQSLRAIKEEPIEKPPKREW